MGGPRMEAAGVERVVRSEDMAVMGFTEVVLHLPRIYREFRKLKRAIRARRPAVAVLIDFPEIHFRLAREFHRLGVPVIYFVSPQLWAWKQHRIRLVREYVRRMLVIFPFEEQYYRERGVEAEFVGHPLADLPLPVDHPRAVCGRKQPRPRPNLDRPAARQPAPRDRRSSAADAGGGARTARCSPIVSGKAAGNTSSSSPWRPRSTPHSGPPCCGLCREPRRRAFRPAGRRARAALLHARASVVASGTATVEAALIGNPFVVVYRVSPLTYAIARRMVKVPHVAMANLIAGKRVVPELIQHDFTAANIVQQLNRLLPDGPARESMMMELGAIREALRMASGQRQGRRRRAPSNG